MLSAKQIEVVKEQAYAGYSYNFNNICRVKPLCFSEILQMGTDVYGVRLGILLLTELEIADIVKKKTNEDISPEKIKPLEYLLNSAANDDMFFIELEQCFSTFIEEDILLLPKINSILIGDMKEKRLITNDNFSDFQDILRIQNRKTIKEPPPENESDIAKKMRLLREKRDLAKKKKQAKEGTEQTLVDLLEIAETFGIDYKNKTIYSFYGLIQRHQLREKWNQDIQMLCAGADSKKIKAKYWGESQKD